MDDWRANLPARRGTLLAKKRLGWSFVPQETDYESMEGEPPGEPRSVPTGALLRRIRACMNPENATVP